MSDSQSRVLALQCVVDVLHKRLLYTREALEEARLEARKWQSVAHELGLPNWEVSLETEHDSLTDPISNPRGVKVDLKVSYVISQALLDSERGNDGMCEVLRSVANELKAAIDRVACEGAWKSWKSVLLEPQMLVRKKETLDEVRRERDVALEELERLRQRGGAGGGNRMSNNSSTTSGRGKSEA